MSSKELGCAVKAVEFLSGLHGMVRLPTPQSGSVGAMDLQTGAVISPHPDHHQLQIAFERFRNISFI